MNAQDEPVVDKEKGKEKEKEKEKEKPAKPAARPVSLIVKTLTGAHPCPFQTRRPSPCAPLFMCFLLLTRQVHRRKGQLRYSRRNS